MRRRLRIVLLAFFAALAAFLFALPVILGNRCADAGGTFDRATFTCRR